MPESDALDDKNFYEDVPPPKQGGFLLKGSGAYDWGMKNRLARSFRSDTSRTVMLAVDHGYFQGPTSGLERMDCGSSPCSLCGRTDADPRGVAIVDPAHAPWRNRHAPERRPEHPQGVVQRADRGRHGGRSTDERARGRRPGLCRRRVRDPVDREHDQAGRRRLPVCNPGAGRDAVGKELVRDARCLGLTTRICAELGAQFVKTYYCDEGFERVTAGCPVPIVMAGGKKLPELDALTMAYQAIQDGAAGVDMGRNISQSEAPTAMIHAVAKVVHENATPDEAYELYQELAHAGALEPARP